MVPTRDESRARGGSRRSGGILPPCGGDQSPRAQVCPGVGRCAVPSAPERRRAGSVAVAARVHAGGSRGEPPAGEARRQSRRHRRDCELLPEHAVRTPASRRKRAAAASAAGADRLPPRPEAGDSAIAELVALATDIPDEPTAHLELASRFARAGDRRNALTQFQSALRRAPGDLRALTGAGEAAFELGQYQLARRYLRGIPGGDTRLVEKRDLVDLIFEITQDYQILVP